MKFIEKALLFLIIIMYTAGPTYAQTRCGTDDIILEIKQQIPEVEKLYAESFAQFYKEGVDTRSMEECPIIIPVHVVVLHDPEDPVGTRTNISYDHILSQLAVLNQDFSRTNADKNQTPPEFSAGDARIQFALASVDPRGNATNGVSRFPLTDEYNIGETEPTRSTRVGIKRRTGWDRDIYLNIWIAPKLDVLGFAKVPTSTFLPGQHDDGVSIQYTVFGGPGFASHPNYNMGRTLTHEVGHFLGLGHIWRSNGCSLDDGISDTPVQDIASEGCPSHPSPSCGNSGDMFMNYMDYTYDACMNAFTEDQGAYMRNILNTSRKSLLASAGYACPEKLVIDMQLSTMTMPSCFGGDDASIEVVACGGSDDNYKYSLDGGPYTSSSVFNNLSAGVYEVTVKNIFGVEGSIQFTINNPEPIRLNIIELTEPSCADSSDGRLLVEAEHFDYHPDSFIYTLGSISDSIGLFENLSLGIQEIVVTNPQGCVQTIPIEITGQSIVSIDDILMVQPSCHGETDGAITIQPKGGMPPYRFSIDGNTYLSDPTFINLSTGAYTLYITDNNGCSFNIEYMLLEPEELRINANVVREISCHGSTGDLQIEATGGNSPIYFSVNGQPFSKKTFYENLPAGNYQIKGKDGKGCESIFEIELSQPEELIVSAPVVTDILCAGEPSGSIEVSVSGGVPFYTFSIDSTSNSTGRFTNLTEGIYTITIKDQNQCSLTKQAIVQTNSPLDVSLSSSIPPLCHDTQDGSITLAGQGGSGVYTYSLNNLDFQNSPTFTGLRKGEHIIYLSDGNDCKAGVPIELPGPSPIKLEDVSITELNCINDNPATIDFSVRGGTGSLAVNVNGSETSDNSIEASQAGNYIIEVIDENFCKLDTSFTIMEAEDIQLQLVSITETNCPLNFLGSITVSSSGGMGIPQFSINEKNNATGFFPDLAGGSHLVKVVDDNGCTDSMFLTVPIIGGLDVVKVTDELPKCFDSADGIVVINATGGRGNYDFSLIGRSSSTGIFEGLTGGVHPFVVSDNFGCTGSIDVILAAPERLFVDTFFLQIPSCNGDANGLVDLDAKGGSAPIRYHYENRTNFTGAFNNLAAGNLGFSISDANGCIITTNIQLSEPDPIRPESIELLSPLCFGDNNGSISFEVKGGTGSKEVTFLGQDFINRVAVKNIASGSYRVSMIDENNCRELLDIFLSEPDRLMSIDTVIIPETFNSLGSIEIFFAGGTKPYYYAIDEKEFGVVNQFEELNAGEYTIQIQDAHDCLEESNITVPYDDSFENPPGTVAEFRISNEGPNENQLYFHLNGDQTVRISIFAINGQLVWQKSGQFLDGNNILSLPTQTYPSGTYILRFDAEKEFIYEKFVKF